MQTAPLQKITVFVLLVAAASLAQKTGKDKTPPPAPAPTSTNPAVEDISGMYSFLKDGEFVQIIVEPGRVSGYISREGDMESDRGQFLDQFFEKASVHGHDLQFVTKPVHGVWFDFKGRFERGPAKTRAEDGYYVLRGTLTEFRSDASKKTSSRAREVEFRLLAQPDDT